LNTRTAFNVQFIALTKDGKIFENFKVILQQLGMQWKMRSK